MASQELGTYQIFDLYGRHPDIKAAAAEHEERIKTEWNNVYVSAWETGFAESLSQRLQAWFDGPLPIPPRGIAFNDEFYGTVIVFPDEKGILHFIMTDNTRLAQEISEPLQYSDAGYWELFEDAARRLQETVSLGLEWLGPAVAVGLGLAVFVALKK